MYGYTEMWIFWEYIRIYWQCMIIHEYTLECTSMKRLILRICNNISEYIEYNNNWENIAMYEYTLSWTHVKTRDTQPNLIFEINIYVYVCLCEPVCKDLHIYTNIYKYMKNIYKYIYTNIHKCIQTYTIIYKTYAKIHKHIHMCSYFHSYTITYTIIPRLSHWGNHTPPRIELPKNELTVQFTIQNNDTTDFSRITSLFNLKK